MKKREKLPPKCKPASKVDMRLTVGQEEVIRASVAFELHGHSLKKTVRYLLQKAVIEEATEQAREREKRS